jgi:hypothetical protein
MVDIKPSAYKNLSASANAVKNGPGKLRGMYVNSTSAGTIKIYDSLTQANAVMNNTITPAVGWHAFGGAGGAAFNVGLSVTIGGTLDVTLYYE